MDIIDVTVMLRARVPVEAFTEMYAGQALVLSRSPIVTDGGEAEMLLVILVAAGVGLTAVFCLNREKITVFTGRFRIFK